MANRLYLALSGGGFRATIFHLGVIRYLRDYGLLSQVVAISSVSGGSVTAAHVVLNWDDYTSTIAGRFDEVQRPIRRLTKFAVRERLVRRTFWYWLLPRFIRSSITTKFADYMQALLFGDKTLKHVATANKQGAPRLILMTTNLTQHSSRTFFSNDHYVVESLKQHPINVALGAFPVSKAVAASAAFPFLFPPLELAHDDPDVKVSQEVLLGKKHLLTDGGVFENLGISVLRDAAKSDHEQKEQSNDYKILISDAGRRLDWEMESRSSRRYIQTLIRSSEISQYWSEERLGAGTHADEITIRLGEHVDSDPAPTGNVQTAVASLRTDLDAFSNLEWTALLSQGYGTAQKALNEHSPPRPIVSDPYTPWHPITSDWDDRYTARALIHGSRRHPWKPWRGMDRFSVINLLALGLLLVTVWLIWPNVVQTIAWFACEPCQTSNDQLLTMEFDQFYEKVHAAACDKAHERVVGYQGKRFRDWSFYIVSINDSVATIRPSKAKSDSRCESEPPFALELSVTATFANDGHFESINPAGETTIEGVEGKVGRIGGKIVELDDCRLQRPITSK